MPVKIIRIITVGTTVLGTFLTFADKYWGDVARLFPQATHSGPIIIGGAVLLHQFLMLLTNDLKTPPTPPTV